MTTLTKTVKPRKPRRTRILIDANRKRRRLDRGDDLPECVAGRKEDHQELICPCKRCEDARRATVSILNNGRYFTCDVTSAHNGKTYRCVINPSNSATCTCLNGTTQHWARCHHAQATRWALRAFQSDERERNDIRKYSVSQVEASKREAIERDFGVALEQDERELDGDILFA